MAFLRPMTMRRGLILVVFVALLPVAVASFIQGMSTLENTRKLAFDRLKGTASAVAERQRDPLHSICCWRTQRTVTSSA